MIGPKVQHNFDSSPAWLYWIARLLMWIWRWDVDPHIPQMTKAVMIAAPHTSNWDAVMMLVAASVYRVKVRFLVKDQAFPWPVGPILRAFGAIPIDRSGGLGIVGQAVHEISKSERILFGVAASGTRRKVERWKSGFYWMAVEADVPILCGYLDYGKKIAGMGRPVYPTGDLTADMDAIRAQYEGMVGYHPEKHTPIRLKEEMEDAAGEAATEAKAAEPGVESEGS